MSVFPKASSPSRSKSSTIAKIAAASAGLLLLASCSSSPAAESEGETEESSAPSSPAREADGVLTVGTILPQTGNLSFLGPPEFAGVDLAAAEISATDYEFEVEVVD